MLDWFWNALSVARSADVERKAAEMVPSDRVQDDPFPALVNGDRFQSGGSYFAVRLAGLHVVNARQFGTQRFPLFVSLAEFRQRGRDRSLPFSIGPREITAKLKSAGALNEADAKPAWVELRNLPIVPPTPVGVGNLSLFVGLYSVPGNDVVATLLDVVGDLSKTAGAILPAAKAVDPALDVVRAVYAGFGSLVGLSTLQALVQAEDGRALPGTGSGYLVVANAPPGLLGQPGIGVHGGKLCRDGRMITDLDYCLVAIERYSTILEEATGIAPDLFDAEWQEVLAALDGDTGAAQLAMRKLLATVRGTPALIDADRTAAMAAYLKRYAEETALAEQIRGLSPTRGGIGDLTQALAAARDGQEAARNTRAADKLTAVLELVDVGQQAPRQRRDERAVVLAREARDALAGLGEGGDDVVADALLRAV